MTQVPSRRRFLQLTGASAAASVAGCSQLRSTDGENDDLDPDADEGEFTDEPGADDDVEVDEEPDIDAADGITAVVQPDQEELERMRAELMQEAEDGELDRQELQLEFVEREAALIEDAATEFETVAADTDDLTIEGSILQYGVFLLDAPGEVLIDALRDGTVDALIPGEEFDAIRHQ